MRKHTEDLPCKVPFCKECLANIKGLANTAKDMMTNPKQAPIETDIDNFLQHAESEFCIANYHGCGDTGCDGYHPGEDEDKAKVCAELKVKLEVLIAKQVLEARKEEVWSALAIRSEVGKLANHSVKVTMYLTDRLSTLTKSKEIK